LKSGIYLLRVRAEDIFTTGIVYDASMKVQGSFTGMEVEEKGYIAVAERDALLRLYSASIKYNDITDVFNPDDEVICYSCTALQ
jgi:hypothetical protein